MKNSRVLLNISKRVTLSDSLWTKLTSIYKVQLIPILYQESLIIKKIIEKSNLELVLIQQLYYKKLV